MKAKKINSANRRITIPERTWAIIEQERLDHETPLQFIERIANFAHNNPFKLPKTAQLFED